MITSDKSYKNLEIKRGYKENDLLGGYDPYSASKASAELAIQSYVNSYFNKNKNIKICIARAGNVIGGGDWSKNRIIPDCYKSWSKNKRAIIRNPNSTRPWQHVLDPLMGYVGPKTKKNYKVKELISVIEKSWKNFKWKNQSYKNSLYESNLLKLNSKKAEKILGWKTKLKFKETIMITADWYKAYLLKTKKMINVSIEQIENFQKK